MIEWFIKPRVFIVSNMAVANPDPEVRPTGTVQYRIVSPSVLQASACNTDTAPTQPHRNSNTHRTKNNTTNVVIQQNSRKLLMMAILMSETCWAHKKWNKIASDMKLVFYSSTIKLKAWNKYLFFLNYLRFMLTTMQVPQFIHMARDGRMTHTE